MTEGDNYQEDIQTDVEAISRIDAVPSILEVICRTTGMGFAAIARVTDEQWIACAVRDEIEFGLTPGGELELETTLCHEISQHKEPVVIDHVTEDPCYHDHATPALYGFQSYISVPITLKSGSFFGTLCAIDPRPARVNTPEVINMFKLFAELVAFHLEAVEKLSRSESKLTEERKTAELREQFIAILGHDLRNPVGAVANVAQILLRMPLDERTMRLALILQDSSFRMKELIENVLDFARGHLGDGIRLNLSVEENLEVVLSQVISELNVVWPDRIIETNFNLTKPVTCDGQRIAQLFSNILGNALTHSRENTPVKVFAQSDDAGFQLSVCNSCDKIPDTIFERLFQPFSRGGAQPSEQGLGLGLYIATEIAKAHGGTLTAKSTDEETTFTFTMPVNPL